VINQQTDLALDSNQGSVLAKVVEEFHRSMRNTQSQWLKLIDSEFQRQIRTPETAPPGLVEYLVALANDQVKSADFTEGLSNRLEQLVSEKYRVAIADKLNDAMDGYLDVAKRCIQILIDTVFNDIKPAVMVLFTPSWYVDEPIHQIIETMADYMADFQARLSPSLFELLVDDIIDTFLITYLNALRKAPKLKIPQAVNTMKEDIKKAFEFFAQYKPPNELETYFGCVSSYPQTLSAGTSTSTSTNIAMCFTSL
jgi:exocyst complex component 3